MVELVSLKLPQLRSGITLILPLLYCKIRYHDGYTECSSDGGYSNCTGVLLGTYVQVNGVLQQELAIRPCFVKIYFHVVDTGLNRIPLLDSLSSKAYATRLLFLVQGFEKGARWAQQYFPARSYAESADGFHTVRRGEGPPEQVQLP